MGSLDQQVGGNATTLERELEAVHLAQIAHRRRSIILFEGPDGAGKKYALKRLAGTLDPCFTSVTCIERDRREAGDGHWLARYWRLLPGAGHSSIFYRSWYRRVLDDRLAGRVNDKQVERAFDEINEFEAQQRDYGTLIVKLYFDVCATVQQHRLAEQRANPWRAATLKEPLIVDQPDYPAVVADLRSNSDTRWSPWTMIDGNDVEAGTQAALAAILNAYRESIPAEPPQLVVVPPLATGAA